MTKTVNEEHSVSSISVNLSHSLDTQKLSPGLPGHLICACRIVNVWLADGLDSIMKLD
jgi:hypothetical protein